MLLFLILVIVLWPVLSDLIYLLAIITFSVGVLLVLACTMGGIFWAMHHILTT
jgi:hypothetical protein